jgi:hypothetical protein
MSLLESFSAGMFLTSTVGEPGTHGATVFGIHGIGVKTPIAAAVADATVGLANDIHVPKGSMFIIGLLSIMLATGVVDMVILSGNTVSTLGAAPKVH